jgi:hypothetical protein
MPFHDVLARAQAVESASPQAVYPAHVVFGTMQVNFHGLKRAFMCAFNCPERKRMGAIALAMVGLEYSNL